MSNPEEIRLTDNLKTRTPDAELHLDDADESLYEDGLEVGDDSETLADTHGNVNKG